MDGVKKKSTEQMSVSSYVVINSYVLDTTLSDIFKRTFQQVRNRLLLFVVFCVWFVQWNYSHHTSLYTSTVSANWSLTTTSDSIRRTALSFQGYSFHYWIITLKQDKLELHLTPYVNSSQKLNSRILKWSKIEICIYYHR